MEFSRREIWSGSPFPSPGDLPSPGIEHGSPALQADCLLSEPPGVRWLLDYHDDHFIMYANVKSLCSKPETNSLC